MSSFYSIPEPNVIDLDLIKTSLLQLQEDQASERLGKLVSAGLGGAITTETIKTPFEHSPKLNQVKILKLEYKNLLRIHNLNGFRSLTKLCLNNNMIERIEGLESLVNLKWLDISFNKISRIQGLDHLVNLTDLSLFQNKITAIEGMDNLKNLAFLSLGNNGISELKDVSYLSKFGYLKSLCLKGNPIAEGDKHVNYTLAMVQTLQYLDYHLVLKDKINVAIEENRGFVDELERQNSVMKKLEEKDIEKEMELQSISKLNLLDCKKLHHVMVSDNPELSQLICLAERELPEELAKYHQKFENVFTELQEFLTAQSKARKAEISEFETTIRDLKLHTDSASLKLVTACKEKLKKVLDICDQPVEMSKVEIASRGQDLYEKLMTIEISTFENIDDIFREFEPNYSQLTATLIDGARQIIQKFRFIEMEMSETVADITTRAFDQLSNVDVDDINQEAQNLLANKDLFSSLVSGVHERFMAILEKTEEDFVAKTNSESENFLSKIHLREWQRNRDRIVEIRNIFCLFETGSSKSEHCFNLLKTSNNKMESVNTSMTKINDLIRHLTWVKSDLATIRNSEMVSNSIFSFSQPATTQQGAAKSASFNFGVSPVLKAQNEPNVNYSGLNKSGNLNKRRVDVLATPQFAEVIRYVEGFETYTEVLTLMWKIADGQFYKEDLQLVLDYIKLLRMDFSRQSKKDSEDGLMSKGGEK